MFDYDILPCCCRQIINDVPISTRVIFCFLGSFFHKHDQSLLACSARIIISIYNSTPTDSQPHLLRNPGRPESAMKSRRRIYRPRYVLDAQHDLACTTHFLPRPADSTSSIVDRRVRTPCPAAVRTRWRRYLRRLARSGNTAGPRRGLSSRFSLGHKLGALLGPHPIFAFCLGCMVMGR